MSVSYSQMEALMMAAGAAVCEVAPGATTTQIPLFQVLVGGDFVGGRLYLTPGWNGSTTSPAPGTWTTIEAQLVAPVTGTAILVVPTLASAPLAGIRVYLHQARAWTVNQGSAGPEPWPVTDQPVTVPGAQPTGTELAADGELLTEPYVVPSDGTILLAFGVDAAAAGTALQHTRDGGATWLNVRRGRSYGSGDEYDVAIPVSTGDSWTARVVTATTVGALRVLFVPSI